MENPVEQNKTPPTPQLTIQNPSKLNTLKIILFLLFGIILIIFSFFIGVKIGENKQSKQSTTQPTPSFTPPQPTHNSTAAWSIYTNSDFGFSFQYPTRFKLSPLNSHDEHYIALAHLSSDADEIIQISVMTDIDVYKQTDVVANAQREVMDSGYKYSVKPKTINEYKAAVTTINDSRAKNVQVTVQYPTNYLPVKNLYIVFYFSGATLKPEFEQILSTFRFTDSN